MIKTKYSEILKQNVSYDTETKILTCADGVIYTEFEIKTLDKLSDEGKAYIHNFKKTFHGTIFKSDEEENFKY
jgi:hypothetical protein